MKSLPAWFVALFAFAILLGPVGCVSQAQYDQLDAAYRKSQEQIAALQQRIDELNQTIAELRKGPLDQSRMIEELKLERDTLLKRLKELEDKIAGIPSGGDVGTLLDKDTDAALKELVAQYPDLLEYDARRGMIKFLSDVTFALGSDQLTPRARDSIAKLARILLTPAASRYEARVVGHTDNVPIVKPETRAKHPTNWHLSAHRAISVREALETSGVPAIRTIIGGAGMQRPVVSNTARGAEANRRVEIYLVTMLPVNDSYINSRGAAPAAPAPVAQPKAPEAPLK